MIPALFFWLEKFSVSHETQRRETMEMYFTLHHMLPEPGVIVGKAHSVPAVIMWVEGVIQEHKDLDGLRLEIEDSHGNLLHQYHREDREYLWH